jgi:hypothetical protein
LEDTKLKKFLSIAILILLATGCSPKVKNDSKTNLSASESQPDPKKDLAIMKADKRAHRTAKNIYRAQRSFKYSRNTYTTDTNGLQFSAPLAPPDGAVQWGVISASTTQFTATATHRNGSGTVYKVDETGVIIPPWVKPKVNPAPK